MSVWLLFWQWKLGNKKGKDLNDKNKVACENNSATC